LRIGQTTERPSARSMTKVALGKGQLQADWPIGQRLKAFKNQSLLKFAPAP
jgi:hypothetical protein